MRGKSEGEEVEKEGKNEAMSQSNNMATGQTATLSKNKLRDKRALHHSQMDIPLSESPVIANFDSGHLTIGAGVAIFHLATSRVIVCRHSLKKYWFLPKGRKDASEDTSSGAEREGYEEVIPIAILLLEIYYIC